MAHAIRIHATAAPRCCIGRTVDVGEPGPGEVRLRQTAVGLNYIDIYHRTGLYKLAGLPAVIGMEGAGTVEAVGPGVTELKVGDRVAYAGVARRLCRGAADRGRPRSVQAARRHR